MKKRRMVLTLMSLALITGLASCSNESTPVIGEKGDKGDKGDTGADGNDAPHYGETHTVTYVLVGGAMPFGKETSEIVPWGDCLNLPTPTKTGYDFLGWYFESSDVNDPTRQWTNRDAVFKDITLTAHWDASKYDITLDPDGGTVSSTRVAVEYLGTYTLPKPTKSGYDFIGWYLNDVKWSLTGTYNETSNITLKATWEKTIYSIKLNPNGGTCATTSVRTNQDGTYTLPSYDQVTRDGYVFKGWYNGTEKWDYSGTYPLSENVTLAADWEAVTNYTVTLDFNGGSRSDGSTTDITKRFDNSKRYNGGEQLPVPTKNGFTFVEYAIGTRLVSDDNAVLTDYDSIDGKTLKAFYKADDGSLSGDVYEFGNYPKSKVSRTSSVYSSLSTATDTDNDGWLNYGSEEYAKKVSKKGAYSYFKVEPILWKVLDSSTGMIFAMDILDQQIFYSSESTRTVNGLAIYANNYKYSNLRAWLNGYDGSNYSVGNYMGKGFLNTAFTETEMAMIETTTVDNSLATTGYSSNPYVCDDTNDKVFALSASEAQNSSYGFVYNSAKIAHATDYAIAHGAANYYWLRSPDRYTDSYARYVDDGGDVYSNDVYGDDVGVHPDFDIKKTCGS